MATSSPRKADHLKPTGLAGLAGERAPPGQGKSKVVLGICVLDKKAKSPPMTQILDRLRVFGEFDVQSAPNLRNCPSEVILFGDNAILNQPIEQWPICDALVAFYSSGYPLEKAEAYAALRRPYLVNELQPQRLLHDRRKVYQRLEQFGLPTPVHVIVNRDQQGKDDDVFTEDEDYVEIHGKRIQKPFVEKPVDGDDHKVNIYYPSSAGGGMKELFRKVGNRSSEFHPDIRRVRRDGSYIYEEFMATGGTDVKVYTVGPDYAHAEARKSPVVDGVVMRSADGKEIRYPVLLTPTEKEMAREVCVAFGQAVCGFDLLRCQGRSYVCDVNGWSFVKGAHKYYDDAACVLREMILRAVAPHLNSPPPSQLPWCSGLDHSSSAIQRQGSLALSTFGLGEELRCVIAVIRQYVFNVTAYTVGLQLRAKSYLVIVRPSRKSMYITQDRLLNLMLKYNGGKPRAEAKLKSAIQLQDLLDALRLLVPSTRPGRDSDSEAEDFERTEKLRHVKAVLEEGGHFSGIYRKAQLKPVRWATVHLEDSEESKEIERPIEALLVLKYGGVLSLMQDESRAVSSAYLCQAEELGRTFRNTMYPGEGTGLIRLHSTYRHDLKMYSSDEGRVQMSAAAFAKGLLDLEGQLTPILVSLVSKDASMLDGLDTATIEMEYAKQRLHEIMTADVSTPRSTASAEAPWMVDGGGLPSDALIKLKKLVELTAAMTAQVKDRCKDEEDRMDDTEAQVEIPPYDTARALGKTSLDIDRIAAGLPCGTEGFLLMFARWKKLARDIYNERKDRYDISKIPDIYDSAKYDLVHNQHLNLKGGDKLYTVAKTLADGVIPNEYGINPRHKLVIGAKVARKLLGKILIDMRNTQDEAVNVGRAVREHSRLVSDFHRRDPFNRPEHEKKAREAKLPGTPVRPPRKSAEHKKVGNGEGQVRDFRRSESRTSSDKDTDDDDDNMETQYRLDPKYANVRTPQRHVRTRLYFTSESHIHSLINVLRYCYLDESLQGEQPLVSSDGLRKLFETKELDYLTHIVFRMYENTDVDLSDPRRFRIELMYSPGAAFSPLEFSPKDNDHTLPVQPVEPLQELGSFTSLAKLERLLQPFAMPAEDFPPAAPPQGFSGLFIKGGTSMIDRLVHFWPFRHHKPHLTAASSQQHPHPHAPSHQPHKPHKSESG
eukprot:SM000316S12290  [mRNA]  locus=s316:84377:92935:+ [translate_table: standard]